MVSVRFPSFDRPANWPPVAEPPNTPLGWVLLHRESVEELIQLGLHPWSSDERGTLMLFPGEWYEHIPNGLVIDCFDGDQEMFQHNVTSADRRWGMLAFGIYVKREP